MFERILLPTDFSDDSQRVLGYVKDIPGVRDAILFHVVDATRQSVRGWTHAPEIENAKILLAENRVALEKSGVNAGVAVETIVKTILQGTVPLAILRKAEDEKVSLIMMGARGRNTIRKILLGSVSADVIRSARIPVLLMRFLPDSCAGIDHPQLFSRILVPVDFSGASENVIALLKQVHPAGQIVLLHVVDKGESEEEIRVAVKEAQEKLFRLQEDLASAGIAAEPRVHVGYPPDEIDATARRSGATLIVMSPQGEGWSRELRALFPGSTTSEVIRRADRPILIAAGGMTIREQADDSGGSS